MLTQFRRRVTYSNVTATFALMFAMGGGAYAAIGSIPGAGGVIHGCYSRTGDLHVIRAGGTCPKGSKPLDFNQSGPRGLDGTNGTAGATGPVGPQGPKGDTGAQGLKGDAGSQGLKGDTGSQGPPGQQYVWTGNGFGSADPGNSTSGGEVARLAFTPTNDGFALVTAHFAVRARNTFDAMTPLGCDVRTQISAAAASPGNPVPNVQPTSPAVSAPGYIVQILNSNLPTQGGAGGYLGLDGSISRVLPVTGGALNTVYLNGSYNNDAGTHCTQALWGPITMTAVFFENSPSATLTTP